MYIRLVAIRINYIHIDSELSLIDDIFSKFKNVLSINMELLDEVNKYDNI